ncbi:MAG: aldehyde dehydrogenase family protein, partial [Blastocatellia bacterium]
MINLSPFKNEAFADFSDERNAQAMQKAIEAVEAELGREYPIIIGGERYTTGDLHDSLDPSKFDQVVGRVHHATKELADKAIEAAWKAFETWKYVPAQQRANYLLKASAEMRRRKNEF